MRRLRFKRLFRFSLRTAFVLTTVLCLWLGMKVREVKQQKGAVAWVMENGGHVEYDFEANGKGQSIPNANLPGPKWLHQLIGEDFFRTAVGVFLKRTAAVRDLKPLENLTTLESLALTNPQVTDLSPLAKLTNLKMLTLDNTQVMDLSPLS